MASPCKERGWEIGRSLSECIEGMLEDELASDVTIIVWSSAKGTPNVRIPVLKFILFARSLVFEAMFRGNYLKSEGDDYINDAQTEPFKEMLK